MSRRKWTDEKILSSLRDIAHNTGHPPSSKDPEAQRVIGPAKKRFGSWRHALRIAGLQTYKEWKSKYSVASRIRNFLNGNPSTFQEIKKAIGDRSATVLITCKDIESIGPRRAKIYFLVGQEGLAQKRLETVLAELDPFEELVLDLLQSPMTFEQIENNARSQAEIKGLSFSRNKVENSIKILRLAELIYKVEFTRSGGHGGTKYSCFKLFGDLANQRYYFRYDLPSETAAFVSNSLPRVTSIDFRRALRSQLRNLFPPEVVDLILESRS